MRFVFILLFVVAVMAVSPAFAQGSGADTNMQILREKVKADKKLVVAAGMGLSDAEGKAFWPVYDAYQVDLQLLNERLAKTILAYADAYNGKTPLTDALAKKLSDEALAIDQDEVTMRKKFSTRLAKVLPGVKAARYMQIENKIRALIRFDMAAGIPLVQ